MINTRFNLILGCAFVFYSSMICMQSSDQLDELLSTYVKQGDFKEAITMLAQQPLSYSQSTLKLSLFHAYNHAQKTLDYIQRINTTSASIAKQSALNPLAGIALFNLSTSIKPPQSHAECEALVKSLKTLIDNPIYKK